MSHTYDLAPGGLGMGVLKLFCEHIGSFSDNLKIFHHSVIEQCIGTEIVGGMV